ncbi:MAG: DUF1553 domain-containing protein [Planctomycetia bacterium]|nr:DUF1553 domain-containing protein [Planctomycetia bacterium]
MKSPLRFSCPAAVVACAIGALAGNRLIAAEPPALPPIVELATFPAKLELNGVRDSRRVLVSGKTADGLTVDLTIGSQFAADGEAIALDKDGYVSPRKEGTARLIVKAAGKEIAVPVEVKDAKPVPVSFVREIQPSMSKVGCNAGTCHGAQEGKNGFKLTLRGYDPETDYFALVDDLSGRRFNRSLPSQSLMLLKPTQGVPHVGGFLFDEDSRYYKLIHSWIGDGCQYDNQSRVTRLEVFPTSPVMDLEGRKLQQVVIAHYPDGTSRDVTRDAVFSSSNFNVATVTNTIESSGVVESLRRGETAILVRYEGDYAANQITVLGDRTGFVWADTPEFNYVDTHVNNKLKKMKTLPAELCNDAEFLRRVSVDLTGLPPSLEQVKAFLGDLRDTRVKRNAKIDELLETAEYIDHWTLKWSDLLLANRKFVTEKGVWGYRNWIRSGIAANKPYDKFVSELLTSNGSTFQNPAANYYRISREPTAVMENLTQVFLGTRFSCNKCHDHPFERWTQGQYYQLSAYFAGVGRKPGSLPEEEVVYPLRSPQPVVNPRSNVAVAAKFPFDHSGSAGVDVHGELRDQLSQWLTSKDNPYFATALVNRYWSYLMGRGIIDPVDDIRSSNPASNADLLKALADDFLAHNMDMKHLLRTIAQSHSYQRSFQTNKWNADDGENYSHFNPRRLTAEQLFDAIMIASSSPVTLPGVPAGFRATQLPDPNIQIGFLDMFGRPPREIPCECERAAEVSLAQTLNLINGPTVSEAIIHPQGLIARLLAANTDEKTLIEDLYLSVLNRYPTDPERTTAAGYFLGVASRAEAAQDLMWALMNSPAFLFNR